MTAPMFESGKAGALTVNSVVVYITDWDATVKVGLGDSTSSYNFSSGTSTLWGSQVAGKTMMSGSIGGWWDMAGGGTAACLAALLAGLPVSSSFNFDATNIFSTGMIQLENIKTGVKVNDDATTIAFTADYMSSGVQTLI